MKKIYFGRPFTGQDYKDVLNYYEEIRIRFRGMDVEPIIPLTGSEDVIEGAIPDNAEHFNNPILTDRAIVKRDKWLLKNSDILIMDFSIEAEMSIGCLFELAWAYDWGLHTVTVIPKDSKMNRVFIRECADVIFETLDDALIYVNNL